MLIIVILVEVYERIWRVNHRGSAPLDSVGDTRTHEWFSAKIWILGKKELVPL
jgi:hypothetical protein